MKQALISLSFYGKFNVKHPTAATVLQNRYVNHKIDETWCSLL